MTNGPAAPDGGFVPEPVKSSVDQVRLSILDAIASGRVRPGDRLPSELEQARGFQVSRTAVREALRSLAELGLISTVQGRGGGSFVNRMDSEPVERNLKEAVELLLRQAILEPRRGRQVDRCDRPEHDQAEHHRKAVAERPQRVHGASPRRGSGSPRRAR